MHNKQQLYTEREKKSETEECQRSEKRSKTHKKVKKRMLVFDWCFVVVVFFALLSPRFVLSMDCGRVLIKYELRYIYLCICFFIYWASTLLTCCDRLVFRLLFLKLCLIFWSDVSSRYNLHARLGANDQVTNIQFADDAAAVLTRRYATSAFLSAPAVTALNWCKQRTRPRVEPSRLD